jgi:CHASE2 domain-containing sensor protein
MTEQARGRFTAVNESFLDYLVSNSRSSFQPNLSAPSDVVHVMLDAAQKAEYAAWPPAPVDYVMILRAVKEAQPSAVLFTEDMSFTSADATAVEQLAELLLQQGINCVFSLHMKGEPVGLADQVPALPTATASNLAPKVLGETKAPHLILQRLGDLGCCTSHTETVPLAYADGQGTLHASNTLLALLRGTRSTLAETSLKLGPGARILLTGGLCVPLEANGTMTLAKEVPQTNALDLMTLDSLNEDEAQPILHTLGKGKILVLGAGAQAAIQAQALRHALAIPRFKELSFTQQTMVWAGTALLGCTLLFLPRRKALTRSWIYLLLALVGSTLAFQFFQYWCAPSIPALLLLAAGVIARFIGKTS